MAEIARRCGLQQPSLYYYFRSKGELLDEIVGEANAAPPGEDVWWVANLPLQWAHADIYKDPRIMADIVRRLRGEEPIATEPRVKVPE